MTLSQAQFRAMFRTCQAAFRLESQTDPLPAELAAFAAWQDGNPLLPSQWAAWGNWLDFTRSLGRKITRVRLVSDPPTAYQQWCMWGTPYHCEAGDEIRYMPRAEAENLGIIPANWWLFDSSELVTMNTDATGLLLVTDPGTLKIHGAWRDLALSQALQAVP